MAAEDPNLDADDDYDEEADSDFDEHVSDAGSTSSLGEGESTANKQVEPARNFASSRPVIEELDSGDEVTIKERQKSKKKQKRRKDGQVSSGDEQNEEWRAKTRSMRAQEHAERQKKTLVSLKSSTVDVNKIWEEMNRPGPLPPIHIEGQPEEGTAEDGLLTQPAQDVVLQKTDAGRLHAEETITIKRRYRFAGEMHIEETTVPRSSAEAKLWLAQQEKQNDTSATMSGGISNKQRPLRKFSRFDPNHANLEAFQNQNIKAQLEAPSGPKLNVVEKSKMDWAAHVDKEGLKEELDVHAKAKNAYLSRVDFLDGVRQRQEEEARAARQMG